MCIRDSYETEYIIMKNKFMNSIFQFEGENIEDIVMENLEDLIEDERFSSIKARSKDINTLYNLVRKSVVKKTNKECIEVLQKAEIPFGVVNRLEDLKDDPQLKSLDFFREYNHPTEGKLEIPDSAFRYNRHSLPVRRHQPKLGEQSEEILKEDNLPKNLKKVICN